MTLNTFETTGTVTSLERRGDDDVVTVGQEFAVNVTGQPGVWLGGDVTMVVSGRGEDLRGAYGRRARVTVEVLDG